MAMMKTMTKSSFKEKEISEGRRDTKGNLQNQEFFRKFLVELSDLIEKGSQLPAAKIVKGISLSDFFLI